MLCNVLNCSVMYNSLWPMDYSSPGSSVHGDSAGKNSRVGCHALLQGIFQASQADSLPSEPPEKRKNTVVGSLSLLQGNFLTQDSNWGLLHSRWFFTIWATREAHFSTASSTKETGQLKYLLSHITLSSDWLRGSCSHPWARNKRH